MGSWLSVTAQLMADAQANVLGKGAECNRLLQNGFCLSQVVCNGTFIRISGSVQASPLNDSDEKCSGERPTVVIYLFFLFTNVVLFEVLKRREVKGRMCQAQFFSTAKRQL